MEYGFDAAGEFPDHLADDRWFRHGLFSLLWGVLGRLVGGFEGAVAFSIVDCIFQQEADQARKRSSLLVGPVFEIHCNAVGKATTDFSCHMCGYQGVGSVFMLLLVAHMSHDPHPEILI